MSSLDLNADSIEIEGPVVFSDTAIEALAVLLVDVAMAENDSQEEE